ncbi:MAG: putative transport system permease protein [Actinomycetota bacterium]|nr:putative transport system permease protein [Actinomycetota bacterium]
MRSEFLSELKVAGLGPLWKRAPFVLRHFPAVLIAVLCSAFVLGLAASANSLFYSSESSAVLGKQLSGPDRWAGGFQVVKYGTYAGPGAGARHARWNNLLQGATRGLGGLGPLNLSVVGLDVQVQTPGSKKLAFAHLLTRSGALANVTVLKRGGPNGVWLAATNASYLHVSPGDNIHLAVEGATTSHHRTIAVRVTGIYQNLGTSSTVPEFWIPLQGDMLPPSPQGEPPPPWMIAGPHVFERIEKALGPTAKWQWNYPVRSSGLTVPEAQSLAGRLGLVQARLHDPTTELGKAFVNANYQSSLPDLLAGANAIAASTQGPIGAIAIAGILVALFVVAAAGVFGVQRRRVEIEFLSARGVTPASLGLRAALEALLPVIVGTAVGWLVARFLVSRFGPSAIIGTAASQSAIRATVICAIAAVIVLGIMAGAAARLQTDLQRRKEGTLVKRVPWEFGLLLLAGASYYEINARGSAPLVSGNGDIHVDTLTLLFPILFVAGAAGLAARLLGRILEPLRRVPGGRWPSSLYFAVKRLANAPRAGVMLVTAATVSIGILLYAGTLAASIEASSRAKAEVFIGSDVATPIAFDASHHVPHLGYPATPVTKLESVQVVPGDFITTTLLGIDPSTFASSAFWDHSFSSAPLDELVSKLGSALAGQRLPAVIVGQGFPPGGSLDYSSARIPIRVVGTARAWPGMAVGRPMIVTTNDAFTAALKKAGTPTQNAQHELWIKGDTAGILRALDKSGLAVAPVTAAKTEALPGFLALHWTLGFLEALGLLTGAIALVGIVLYLQARQRARQVAYALSRRMGLGGPQHLRAIGLELAGMLLPALLIGVTLSALATKLVYQRLDPLPAVPPPALLRWPGELIAVTAGTIVLLTIGTAWLVQRSADRGNVAELMRLAE